MHKNNIVIGVDFDNTIADYDEMMYRLARKEGLISAGISTHKRKIRDHIRSLNDGEIKWQELQAKVYGKFMFQAKLIEGVQYFFLSCHKQGIPIFIISHKTQFAAQDKERYDLHRAAKRWMKEKGFFQEDRVFFEPHRQKKIERIKAVGCTHFIDDLEEIFLDKTFPQDVQKILYAPHSSPKITQDVLVKGSWKAIYDEFFTNNRK